MSPMSLEQPEQSDRPDLPASSNPSWRPSGPILFNSIIGSWLVVNTVGFAIATALMASVFWFPSVFERPQASVSHVSGFVVGVVLGPLQAIVLRRKVPKLKGWQWMLAGILGRSEEHTSELQSQSTISYAVFCLKKKKTQI